MKTAQPESSANAHVKPASSAPTPRLDRKQLINSLAVELGVQELGLVIPAFHAPPRPLPEECSGSSSLESQDDTIQIPPIAVPMLEFSLGRKLSAADTIISGNSAAEDIESKFELNSVLTVPIRCPPSVPAPKVTNEIVSQPVVLSESIPSTTTNVSKPVGLLQRAAANLFHLISKKTQSKSESLNDSTAPTRFRVVSHDLLTPDDPFLRGKPPAFPIVHASDEFAAAHGECSAKRTLFGSRLLCKTRLCGV